ncbi:MAG TPA: ABC transporter ATP-binding protein [Propionibacteriaceae bacterium]|nr:ABC transporter ATP-binding protein [Propionibacteriaceae bacterium]
MPARPREVTLRETFRRFWPFAAPRRKWLAFALLVALLPPAIGTVEIYLFKVLVDDVLIPRNFNLFLPVAALYVGLTVLDSGVGGVERMLSTWLSQRFLIDLRAHVLAHLQKLSPSFFQRNRLGDLLTRMSGDIAAIETFVLSSLTSFISSLLQLVFFVGALFYLQWKLALVALIVTPLFWYTARRFSARIKTLSREKQRLSGSIASVVEQTVSNVALVQAYGQERRQLGRFSEEAEKKYRVEMASAKLKSIYTPIVDLIELLGVLTVIGAGAWLLARGEFTVGGLLAFLTYLNGLYGPVRSLGSLANAAFAASASAERVIQVLDERPAVTDRADALNQVPPTGHLEVRDLSFTYPGTEAPALEGVSFSAAPNETVAVVGASGAGKSTLAKMLVRFYDPDEGAVLLDGRDVRELTLDALRRNISVLLQETLLLDGSVRDNIAYGRQDASEAEIIRAAQAADAHEFIMELPDGYDTEVGERGRRLSGGQGQRLAMARAMLRDAPVLLLDEPTTGLDANSTDRVIEPLRRLMVGRATIIISHNLTTVREANRIIVLDHGRVVERGNHAELLRANGIYAKLWRISGQKRANGEPVKHSWLPEESSPRARRARVQEEIWPSGTAASSRARPRRALVPMPDPSSPYLPTGSSDG